MHPIPELTPLLKQLRLSGILDSLEARNREAIDRKLAFTDFLSLLIHDEVARREQKKLDVRLRRANFRSQKTLEGFDFDRLPTLNRAAVHDLATCRFIEEKVAVLIVGPCGTGKSHLAQSLGHAAARRGHDVLVHHANPAPGQLARRPRDRHLRAAVSISGQGTTFDH
ncbi:MAG: ATP-binding protein [Sideroxyarcus sp.]|nr:ATP-binding protein [Sideroxyarcus sp.]